MPTTTDKQGGARARLLALAEHPDAYLFLGCVGDYLAVVPTDDQVRATAMRLAVAKGLFSVAREYALACPKESLNHGQLAALAEQFTKRCTDLLSWVSTDHRFAANLNALRARGGCDVELAERIQQAWQDMPPHMTLHRASDGNLLVRAARSDGQRIWLPAAQDFVGSTEAIDENVNFHGEFVSPFLLDGAGIGCLVPRLYAATCGTYLTYSPAIYLVETNLRALALALRLHDWTVALADARFIIRAGPTAWKEWAQLMQEAEELPEPQHTIALARWPGTAPNSPAAHMQEIKQSRQASILRHRAEVDALYADRDASYWARRFVSAGPDDPLRVLCLTSRHTTFLRYSIADLEAAFKRAGLVTRLVVEEADHTALNGAICMRHFKSFDPDLVVVIDHHRFEMPERFAGNVPFLCWIQDELPRLYSIEAGQNLGPLDFTMGFGKEVCVKTFDYAPERFMPCTLAVSPEKFAPIVDQQPDASLNCDVAYVGHHAETPAALHARIRGQVEPPITDLIDAFYEEMMPRMRSPQFTGAFDLAAMLREVLERTNIALGDEESRVRMLGVYVRPLADRVLRHSTLEWVADWAEGSGHRLHLYGRGWEAHPRFSRFARGEARHGAHLGAIVRAAAINLHFGINVALHQRVLETAIAGGFLLVRYHPHDFRPEWLSAMREFILANNIALPARIAYEQLPGNIVTSHREQMQHLGRAVTGYVEVYDKFLLRNDPREVAAIRNRWAGEMFPGLGKMTFDSPESFAARADHFLANPDERAELSRAMRQTVEAEYTYDALAGRALNFVREQLRAQAT